jgi:hypothetical protein
VPRPTPLDPASIGRRVEQIDPTQLVDRSADDLLEEIRRKQARVSIVLLSALVALGGLGLAAITLGSEGADGLRWGALAVAVIGLASLPWAAWWDRRSRVVHIRYMFDPMGEKVHEGLERLLTAFQHAHAIWSVHTEHVHGDWKRNAGAGTSVGRRQVRVGWGPPSVVRTNARVGFLDVEGTKLYFFPDRLLVFGHGGVSATPYSQLGMQAGQVRFIEEGQVPRDARLMGKTWRFVNKDGGPDRRFANNYQLPVVSYGTLELWAPSGLRMRLQTSTERLASGAVDLLRLIQAAIRDLESRNALGLQPAALSPSLDDPPPLLLPARALVRTTVRVLSFRWLSGLPDWGTPIVCGLVLSLPLVAILAMSAGSRGLGPALFLGGSLVVAGALAVNLTRELLRGRRARRAKEAANRGSRFRALLMNELRSRPSDRFDFAALVADGGLPREEADRVADELFRRIADRIVADGVITAAERAKLDVLAKVLEMDAARATLIEEEAKSAIYQRAVAGALADGTVTEEEARMLNDLRDNLGVQDSPWIAGDVVS